MKNIKNNKLENLNVMEGIDFKANQKRIQERTKQYKKELLITKIKSVLYLGFGISSLLVIEAGILIG